MGSLAAFFDFPAFAGGFSSAGVSAGAAGSDSGTIGSSDSSTAAIVGVAEKVKMGLGKLESRAKSRFGSNLYRW